MKTKSPLLLVTFMLAAAADAQVLTNDAVLDGKTLGEWSAEWWKWILPIPVEQNPAFDPDGSFANVGQPDGPVFFLAKGYNVNRIGHRAFTVPEGKYLFMPLLTYYADNINSCPPCYSVQELRDQAKAAIDPVTNLHATVDGIAIPDLFSHRNISPVFSINFLSTNNLVSWGNGIPFAGLDDPMAADGFYLMLEPLTPGLHVLNFGAIVGPPINLIFDMTDTITVIPEPLPDRVQRLVTTLSASALPEKQRQPLLVTLNAAKASFDSKNLRAGINQLAAFQNKVRAQWARNDQALADLLIEAAQEIMDKAAAQLR